MPRRLANADYARLIMRHVGVHNAKLGAQHNSMIAHRVAVSRTVICE
jgi:hypothetical protein